MTTAEYWTWVAALVVVATLVWASWVLSRWTYDRKIDKDEAPYWAAFDKFYEACRDWHRAVPMTEDARVETDRRLHAAITDFIEVEEEDRSGREEPTKK